MKAITISQPYATLIANGTKFIENRTWPPNYIGKLAIHAGRGTQYLDPIALERYPTSCVIAVCDLVGCLHIKTIQAAYEKGEGIEGYTAQAIAQMAEHEHAEGPYCWLLKNIQKLRQPVSVRGRQKLWNFDDSLIKE